MKNIVISTTSQKPIYQQLYNQLSSQILSGDLQSNTLLPSIRVTAKELRVSIITIKKTWELLERDGYIDTVAGKGSYVKKNSQATLDKKRNQIIKKNLKENVVLCKSIGISKEVLLDLVLELYEE